jgi:hypothetical protein
VLQLQAANTTVLNAELGKALALQGATSTTGCGIAFPSTQVASSDVNTLDDYEEGTWTPTDASGAGLTLTVTAARYTKIGRLVTVIADITYPTTANSSSAEIGGLPFASSGVNAIAFCFSNKTTQAYSNVIVSGGSNIRIYNSPSNYTRATNLDLSTLSIGLDITYFAST